MPLDNNTRMVMVFVVAYAVFELGREMRESCPPMTETRQAEGPEQRVTLQHLIDGEGHVGIMAVAAALIAWWATQDFLPAAIILATFAGLCWYQHSVLRAPAIY